MGLSVLVDNLEGEVLDVVLDRLVLELLADETFLRCDQYVKNRARRRELYLRHRKRSGEGC